MGIPGKTPGTGRNRPTECCAAPEVPSSQAKNTMKHLYCWHGQTKGAYEQLVQIGAWQRR